jgi:hypothetical protein
VKRTFIWTGVAAAIVSLIVWVSANTHWVDTEVPTPLKGEALTNPFYAVQRFADNLGARTAWHRSLVLPPPDAIVLLSSWNWGISAGRRQAIERWVESGGRLVVDSSLIGGEDEFEEWTGIVVEYRDAALVKEQLKSSQYDSCRKFDQFVGGSRVSRHPELCNTGYFSFLKTTRPIAWELRDPTGAQAMRVAIGRGSVTAINAAPFHYRGLFDGDHGAIFVDAAQLEPGDQVFFLTEDEHASLVTLIWRHGAPVVVLVLAAIALMLWRGAVRFGPLAAAPAAARRSLAEQIRGTGEFLVRNGGADSLHAAAVRALDEAAGRRVPAYARETVQERSAILARLTGFDAGALTDAVYHPRMRRPYELRRTIALLEAARRLILTERRRRSHGRQ